MLDYLWASAQATGRVALLAGAGVLAAKRGYFPKPFKKGLSILCKDLMLPCLLLATVPPNITQESVSKFWVLPLACSSYVLVGLALGLIVARLFCVPAVGGWGAVSTWSCRSGVFNYVVQRSAFYAAG